MPLCFGSGGQISPIFNGLLKPTFGSSNPLTQPGSPVSTGPSAKAPLANLNDHSIALLTIAMGAVLGILVTFASVGAGAIGVTALVLLYPRVSTAQIVGSDIAHAVPLTLIAGLGHGVMGSVDLHTLVSLLAGSLPGIFVGSSISARVPDTALRYVLAAVLIVVGSKLAVDLSAQPRATAHMTPASKSGCSVAPGEEQAT